MLILNGLAKTLNHSESTFTQKTERGWSVIVNQLSNLGYPQVPRDGVLPLTVFLARNQSHGLQCANREPEMPSV